jgi:hypothetical protein
MGERVADQWMRQSSGGVTVKSSLKAGLMVWAGLLFASGLSAASSDDKEIDELIDNMDRLWVDGRTHSTLEMKISTKHYERELKLQFWGIAKEKSLIRITYPPKENGVSTLKVNDDVYNYLPKIARTIKLSQALMSQSWMGSHFTNDDLVRVTHLKDDYVNTIKEKKGSGADEIWIIESTVRPQTVTPWKTMIISFNRKTRMPIEQQFFNKDRKMERVIYYKDVKQFGGKKIPALLRVEPLLGSGQGEYTELYYRNIDQKAKFDDDLFSLTRLGNQ